MPVRLSVTLMSIKTFIICSDSHKSACTVSFLRLLGYNQIYSLDYGLGYWNKKFSNVWLQNIDDSPLKGIYTTNSYPKSKLNSDLPVGFLEDDAIDIRDQLFAAGDYLLKSNFDEYMISMPEFEEIYNFGEQSYNFAYIICYGDIYLYEELVGQTMGIPPTDFGSHPKTAVHYNPIAEKEFMLSTTLLTIPPDQELFIY